MKLGVNRATVSKYETGQIEPTISQLQAFADALGVHLLDLLGVGPAGPAREGRVTMNMHVEIDPSMVDDAVEAMRALKDYCEADACALARLDSQEARELAQARLQAAATADRLLYFFASL